MMNDTNERIAVVRRQKKIYLARLERNPSDEGLIEKIDVLSEVEKGLLDELADVRDVL